MGYVRVEYQQDKIDLYNQLKKLRLPYVVCFESIFRPRGLNQNKYYWRFIIKVLAEETGKTKREIEHELLIENACVNHYKDEENKVIYEVERTSGMDSMRLEKYLEDCRAYALVQYSVYLLAPREVIQDALDLHGKTKRIVKEQEV